MIESVAASAKRFSQGGYEVFVDGVITPNFLTSWIKIAEEGIDVRYIVLRPSEQITVTRASEREQNIYYPLESEVVRKVWNFFSELGKYESHSIDTSTHTVDESATLIEKNLHEGSFRII